MKLQKHFERNGLFLSCTVKAEKYYENFYARNSYSSFFGIFFPQWYERVMIPKYYARLNRWADAVIMNHTKNTIEQ